MIRSIPLRNPMLLLCPQCNLHSKEVGVSSVASSSPITTCCSSRTNSTVPKLEPFSRSKFDRVIQDPPLIQKAENDLTDYCSTLEGDAGYSCWRAYFELKDLEIETPKEDIERVILQAGGTKSLIGCLHGIAGMHKEKKEMKEAEKVLSCNNNNNNNIATRPCPVPDGLPKSTEEMEEEAEGKMLDSPFTRLLRTIGRSPTPDHD